MPADRTSRRDFLLRCAALGAAGSLLGTSLSACGGGSDAPADAGGACSDLSALSPAEAQQRRSVVNALSYVEASPVPEKQCENCNLWKPPTGGAFCGGCTLIKGPINPGGYCTSWVAAAA